MHPQANASPLAIVVDLLAALGRQVQAEREGQPRQMAEDEQPAQPDAASTDAPEPEPTNTHN